MTDAFSNLPPHLADHLRKIISQREEQGLNVHFINARGEKDRYSFESVESRDKFIASLKRAGRTIL